MAVPSQTPYTRRDVWALEHTQTWDPYSLAYAQAVREMQGRQPSDPTSWSYQAAMHGTYSQPSEPDWNNCQHASWFFLPWHRMFIYWFERIVRSIVVAQGGPKDWALFYWNYSSPYPWNTLPPAFRAPTLPDGSANPLYLPDRRAAGIENGNRLPSSATSFAYAFTFINFVPPPAPGQFENATGALENQPHNIIHDLVGGPASGECDQGWMSDPNCAAQDPIFWLHHSNIDRLWVNWLIRGGGRANPNDQRWLTQQYSFFDEKGGSVTMKVSDVLSTSKLGYRYQDAPPRVARTRAAIVAPVKPQDPVEQPPHTEVAASDSVQLGSAPTTVSVPLPPEAKDAVAGAIVPPGEKPASSVYLNVEGIKIDDHPGVVYEVYVDLPDAHEGTEPLVSPHFAGHITFFGAKHGHGHGHGGGEGEPEGLKHSFDITGLVNDLQQQGLWSDDELSVTFVPRSLLPPREEEVGAAEAEVHTAPDSAAYIGRVTLTTT